MTFQRKLLHTNNGRGFERLEDDLSSSWLESSQLELLSHWREINMLGIEWSHNLAVATSIVMLSAHLQRECANTVVARGNEMSFAALFLSIGTS